MVFAMTDEQRALFLKSLDECHNAEAREKARMKAQLEQKKRELDELYKV